MLPSTGLFKAINCPFYDADTCLRPFCHFRHTKKDNDTKKVTTNSAIVYNATPLNQLGGQPKIQILEPPVVYKPTPKSLLASSSSYSPPVKKPKLEYVPKSKSNFASIATYVPSTVKSNSDNEGEAQKSGWDYLSELIEPEPSSNVDKTPTYVPTKINRSTSDDIAKSTENVITTTGDENENRNQTNDDERKNIKSKPEKTKSRHDRHKSGSQSTSRSHSHSSKNKHESSSKTSSSSERNKSSSRSTHRSSHDKAKSRSSRSDSKSSVDKNGSESRRSDKTQSSTKSSKLSSKTKDKNVDNASKKKSKSSATSNASSEKDSVAVVPVNLDCNISPSSVFDTDSEEDDVMAQCRMIFDEFKEVSNNGKTNELMNGSGVRKSVEEQIDVTIPADESNRKKRVAYEKADKLRSDSKKPVVGIDYKRNAMHQIYKRYEDQRELDRKREKEKAENDTKKQLIEATKIAALKVATATSLRLPVSISKPQSQTTTSTSASSSTTTVLTPLIPHAMRPSASRPGQRTITPVNNFAAIQRAKEKVDQMKAAKGFTVAQSAPKMTGRIAHSNKANSQIQNIDRPAPPVLEGSATKISYNIRMQYYNMMVKHCLTIYDNCEDAWERAQTEELSVFKKCSTPVIYKSSALLAINKLRKQSLGMFTCPFYQFRNSFP